MKVVFMGTPDFAVPALKALVAAGHQVVCAYTQPPRPGGRRGKELTPTPVHRAAEELGIPVRHPASLKGAVDQAEFAALGADIAVVAAYGLILPQAVLDAPHLGCLNVHASLLPRWRGAAPIQRAILAGDTETGVTIMQMEAGLDTGPMLATVRTPVDGKTAGELTEELAELGGNLMIEVLADLPGHVAMPQPAEGVTYAHKINKAETRIEWSRGAAEVERQVRAFAPAPGAFFELGGERCKVLAAQVLRRPGLDPGPVEQSTQGRDNAPAVPDQVRNDAGTVLDDHLTVACATGAIRPALVQREGRPAMPTAELLRGWSIPVGIRLE